MKNGCSSTASASRTDRSGSRPSSSLPERSWLGCWHCSSIRISIGRSMTAAARSMKSKRPTSDYRSRPSSWRRRLTPRRRLPSRPSRRRSTRRSHCSPPKSLNEEASAFRWRPRRSAVRSPSLTWVNLIIEQAMAALGAQSAALAALEGKDTLRFIAVRNVSTASVGATVDVGEARPLCAAVRTVRPIILESLDAIREAYPDVAEDIRIDHVRAVAALPIDVDGRVIGGITVRFTRGRVLSSVDRSFMIALTRIAGEAFERARLSRPSEAHARRQRQRIAPRPRSSQSMSHELRTPLQRHPRIRASCSRSGSRPRQRAAARGPRPDRAESNASRRLIDDILDFARLETGRVAWRWARAASTSVSPAGALVEPQAAKKQHRAIAAPAVPGSICVRADRQSCRQILVNLVGNAIKFTGDGGDDPCRRVGERRPGDDSRHRHRRRDSRRPARRDLRAVRAGGRGPNARDTRASGLDSRSAATWRAPWAAISPSRARPVSARRSAFSFSGRRVSRSSGTARDRSGSGRGSRVEPSTLNPRPLDPLTWTACSTAAPFCSAACT